MAMGPLKGAFKIKENLVPSINPSSASFVEKSGLLMLLRMAL